MKNYNDFLNMHYDVHCYHVKFKNKIQLMFGETRKINCIIGKNDLNLYSLEIKN